MRSKKAGLFRIYRRNKAHKDMSKWAFVASFADKKDALCWMDQRHCNPPYDRDPDIEHKIMQGKRTIKKRKGGRDVDEPEMSDDRKSELAWAGKMLDGTE